MWDLVAVNMNMAEISDESGWKYCIKYNNAGVFMEDWSSKGDPLEIMR